MENVALFASFTVHPELVRRRRRTREGPYDAIALSRTWKGKPPAHALRGRPDHVPIVHCVIPNSFAKGGPERDLTMRLSSSRTWKGRSPAHALRGRPDHVQAPTCNPELVRRKADERGTLRCDRVITNVERKIGGACAARTS